MYFGIKETNEFFPSWEKRQENLKKILYFLLKDKEIKVGCFQEVNQNNLEVLETILKENNFKVLEKFPMKTSHIEQYNLIAVREEIKIDSIFCLPHGNDSKYQSLEHQKIDYSMSDYRTTLFVDFCYQGKSYRIGNIHTDYISIEGKIKGVIKSLNYLDEKEFDYKLIVGDMNMISHMSEAYTILQEKSNYTILSRNENFHIEDQSWHGYGTKEQVNSDFAFIPQEKQNFYEYEIVKQRKMLEEASDHHPILITIKERETNE